MSTLVRDRATAQPTPSPAREPRSRPSRRTLLLAGAAIAWILGFLVYEWLAQPADLGHGAADQRRHSRNVVRRVDGRGIELERIDTASSGRNIRRN